MVDEPVDHGGGNDVVAEHLAQRPNGFVGGDDQAGASVAGGDELEEELEGGMEAWQDDGRNLVPPG